jgi:hypothetical protein
MSVLNAVRNKLLAIVFVVFERDIIYQKKFGGVLEINGVNIRLL